MQKSTLLITVAIALLITAWPANAHAAPESSDLARFRDWYQYQQCREYRYAGRQPGRNLCRSFVQGTHKAKVPRRWASQDALLELIFHESGFDINAVNDSSGACGWAQALPCSKAPRYGAPHAAWMLRYIDGRYGNPRHALAVWWLRSPHWY